MNPKLTIIGKSGHARAVLSICEALFSEVVLVERGPQDDLPHDEPLLVAIGENRVRAQFDRIHRLAPWATIISKRSVVDDRAQIGAGSQILYNVVVESGVRIGRHVIINSGATVAHDCEIGDYAHIAPGVHLGGHCKVGAGAFIGIGSSVRDRITIGEWSVIGAGSVVVKDILGHVTAYGVPAQQKIGEKEFSYHYW